MLIQERYDEILKIIKSEGVVKVSHLVKLFNVSLETVRRDLEYLEKEGKLKKVHGGAVSIEKQENSLNFSTRMDECLKEKQEIAYIASRYIKDGMSIALDAGTTTIHIAKKIKGRFKNLTVVTNSIAVCNELFNVDGIKIILLGGVMDSREEVTTGPLALSIMDKIYVDIAFIGVTGVALKEGFTDFDFNMIEIQKKIMSHAKKRIVLADSSKFNEVSFINICSVDYVDHIITDSNLNKETLQEFIENGVDVVSK